MSKAQKEEFEKKCKEEEKEEEEEEEEEKSVKAAEITEEDIDKTLSTMADILKARKEEEEEEEEEGEEEEEEEEEEKSYTGNFEANETLAKAIEVSDFLASLVDETETSIAAIAKDVGRFQKSQSAFDTKFIEALDKLAKTIEGLEGRLQKVEKTPVAPGPKSVLKANVMEKSFAGKEGDENLIDSLPRSKVAALITKAVEAGKLADSVLFSFEGNRSFQLRDDEKDILKSLM